MVQRWAQELLGYHFTVLHRPQSMMVDVDALTRRFGPLIAHHCFIASYLHHRDRTLRPTAYLKASFFTSRSTKSKFPPTSPSTLPILCTTFLQSRSLSTHSPSPSSLASPTLSTCPLLFTSCLLSSNPSLDHPMQPLRLITSSTHPYVFIDDTIGAALHWCRHHVSFHHHFHPTFIFTSSHTSSLFRLLYPTIPFTIIPFYSLSPTSFPPSTAAISFSFHPSSASSFTSWFSSFISLFTKIIHTRPSIHLISLWLSLHHWPLSSIPSILQPFSNHLPAPWTLHHACFNSASYGDAVTAYRHLILLCADDTTSHPLSCALDATCPVNAIDFFKKRALRILRAHPG